MMGKTFISSLDKPNRTHNDVSVAKHDRRGGIAIRQTSLRWETEAQFYSHPTIQYYKSKLLP